MFFGERLKQERKKRDWSQIDLAEKMFVSRQSVSKWETGKSYPSIDVIIKLSELFDITIDELLRGDEVLKDKIYQNDKGSNYKFQMGLILGIASTVNLFISFLDKEFSLIWIFISILLLAISNIWLLKRKINLDSEKKELYFAKHGVWSTGLLVILFGFFKNGITVNYVLVSICVIILILIQFSLYNYKLKNK